MSLEAALVAGGVELIKFIISKIFDAEKDDNLDTGKKKHEFVKKEVMNRYTNEYIYQNTDDLIEEHVSLFNEKGVFKKRDKNA
jgi:dissimilatory sulfite reductase (desulfoviridin) alpha/beta subunit